VRLLPQPPSATLNVNITATRTPIRVIYAFPSPCFGSRLVGWSRPLRWTL
jgi:hypothetical protein